MRFCSNSKWIFFLYPANLLDILCFRIDNTMRLNSILLLPFKPFSVIGLVLLCVMMTACSSSPKSLNLEQQAEKLTQILDEGGYKPARDFEISNVDDIWLHDQAEIEVAMTAPNESGNYPLIIYLPSLGEDVKAGRLWRENWAKAGYAVFSLQPVAISQALKDLSPERGRFSMESNESLADGGMAIEDDFDASSQKDRGRSLRMARESDLRYLGHEYFAVDNLKNRLDQLFWAYQQLKIRVDMKQPLLAAADLSKVILAGYDLGAQTVTAVLGENFNTTLPGSKAFKPLAAIVLSPSVDLAEGNASNRFQALNLPMLVITGSEDDDPYGISAAQARAVVWKDAPAGDKYLLSLKGARHQLLGGTEIGGYLGGRGKGGHGGYGSREHRSDGSMLGFTNNLGDHSRRQGGSDRFGSGFMANGHGKSEQQYEELGYKHVAAVISTSLAFLDVVSKSDEFARFWMGDKANSWLGETGTLRFR